MKSSMILRRVCERGLDHLRVLRCLFSDLLEKQEEGIARHYIGLSLPLIGIRLDPKLDLAA